MMEKIKPYLNDLKSIYAAYAHRKKLFGRKNVDKFMEFEKNPIILQKVQSIIEKYDASSFWGKLWMRLFWPVEHYKNLVQYYGLHLLIQKMHSDIYEEKENLLFLDEAITFLESFNVKNIQKTISDMYKKLLEIRNTFKKAAYADHDFDSHSESGSDADPDPDSFSIVSVKERKKFVPYVLPLSDEASKSLQDLKSQNVSIVKNMMDLLTEMRKINWKEWVYADKEAAYACYNDLMERFEAALKQCNKLRIPAHPDKQSADPEGALFVTLQETYNTYKAHKEAIKSDVEIYGLAALNAHLPKEKEQSILDLLETLNLMLQAYIESCDRYIAIFKQRLPEQKKELEFLSGELEVLSTGIQEVRKADEELGEKLKSLKEGMGEQEQKLNILQEDSNAHAVALDKKYEEIEQFDERTRSLVIEEMKKVMGDGGGGVGKSKIKDVPRKVSCTSAFFQDADGDASFQPVADQQGGFQPN